MKRWIVTLFLLFCLLGLPVLAAEDGVYLHEDSHWLVREGTEGDLEILSEQFVLSWYRDAETGALYYVALENGSSILYVLADGREAVPVFPEGESRPAVFGRPSKSTETMVQAAMEIIYRNEGNYGSINRDDNGALSVGKVQWHATRALNLLKTVVNADPAAAREILGDALYNEILTAQSWSSRTVSESEAQALSALLVTPQGKAAQDALAATDITAYVEHALDLGLCSSTAIVYLADLENQFGYSGAATQAKLAAEKAGSYEDITLEILHRTCVEYRPQYEARREKAYQACLALGWDEFALDTPKAPEAAVSGKTAVLSWPAVEGAESYTCYIKVINGGFLDYAQVDTEEPRCTVTLEPGWNYCAYVVASSEHATSQTGLWASFSVPQPACSAMAEQTDEGVAVTVTLTGGDPSYCILAAGYRQGRLVSLQTAAVSGAQAQFLLSGDPDSILITVADGESWKPLCFPARPTVPEN